MCLKHSLLDIRRSTPTFDRRSCRRCSAAAIRLAMRFLHTSTLKLSHRNMEEVETTRRQCPLNIEQQRDLDTLELLLTPAVSPFPLGKLHDTPVTDMHLSPCWLLALF